MCETRTKYSFIVHTETKKGAHEWQERVVEQIVARMKSAVKTGNKVIRSLVEAAHTDLSTSVQLLNGSVPRVDEIVAAFGEILPMVNYTRVNSEKDVLAMLDESGQLKLRTPFNIFIGGQILDRGLTIANLIGFFYGRSPKRFQQDTVLQHSRMYGVRPKDDLTVTRFYTTLDIYSAMRNIHEFDSALRETFEQGGDKAGVVFLRADPTRGVIPCSPNKILLSTVTTIRPEARFLPVGFSTDAKTRALKHVQAVDTILHKLARGENDPPFLLSIKDAETIIDHISDSLVMDAAFSRDVKTFKASLNHLANSNPVKSQRGHVACLVRRSRNLGKHPPGNPDRYQSAPTALWSDSKWPSFRATGQRSFSTGRMGRPKTDGTVAPSGGPYYAPPSTSPTVIFASDTVD